MKSIKLSGQSLAHAEQALLVAAQLEADVRKLQEAAMEETTRLLGLIFDDVGVPQGIRAGLALHTVFSQHGDFFLIGQTEAAAEYVSHRSSN
jgi:hypothetical protein